MKGSQLAVRCERVGYNTGMIAFATRQNETAKWAILPRADARAGEGKSATVFNWSDGGDNITVSSPSTHGLLGFYDQEPSNVASVDQSNQQYSILALTDSSGNVSERYAYTAYGQPTFLNASGIVQTSSAANNRYTYTGREWDATLGLHHFRARWMSGLTGRFLTRDPIGYVDGPSLNGSYLSLQKTDAFGTYVWTWRDWYRHYRYAFGSPVDLSQTGLMPAFQQRHLDKVRSHADSALQTAMSRFNCSRGPGVYSEKWTDSSEELWDSYDGIWDTISYLMPLGTSTMTITKNYNAFWVCRKCCDEPLRITFASASASLDFSLFDAFTAPYDELPDDGTVAANLGNCVDSCQRTEVNPTKCIDDCWQKYKTRDDRRDGTPFAITGNFSVSSRV